MQSKTKSKHDHRKIGVSLRQINAPRMVQKMAWIAASTLAAISVIGISYYLLVANSNAASNVTVASGDFRTKKSGNWNSTETWEIFDGSKWVKATTTPSADKGKIEILRGHVVKVTNNISIDQATIASGGKLDCQPGISISIENGEGTDLSINGSLFITDQSKLTQKTSSSIDLAGLLLMYPNSKQEMEDDASITINNGGIFNNGGVVSPEVGNWIFNAGSTYVSAVNGDMIPLATWKQGSVCEIAGATTTKPGNLSQSFYNVIWNCTKQTEDLNLNGSLTKINGDFTFMASGKSAVGLAGSEDCDLKIGGSFNMFGGNFYQSFSSKNSVMNITGNFKQTGGNFTGVKLVDAEKCDGKMVMNISGNFSISAGTFDMSQNNSATPGSGICLINLGGNLIHSGGKITTTASKTDLADNGFGFGQFNFIKAGKQVVNLKSEAINNAINFEVAEKSTLDLGESIITGNGNFNLKENGGIIISSKAGISLTGASGNIQVAGKRSFNSKANYTYKGTAAQITGNGLPEMVNDLVIDNNRHVTLTNKVSVSNVLSLSNGQLITNGNELVVMNASTSSITNYSFKNYVRGSLRRYVNAEGCYDFPIGTSSNYEYMSVTLSNINGCTNLLASFVNSNPVERDAPLIGLAVNGTIIDNALNYGYWTLTPNAPATSGTYNVSLREKGYSNSSSNSTGYCVLTRSAPGSPWQSPGKHVITTQVDEENAAIAMRASLSTFSQYAIGTGGSAPAKSTPTITVETKINDDGIELSWTSNPENASNSYAIERSTDGIRFETIASRPANSSSAGLKFSDDAPQVQAGYIFYRVKQSDDNGHITYSEIKKVKYAGKVNATSGFKLVSCIPNPFSDNFTASFELKMVTPIDFQLVNSEGRVVYEKRVNGIDGINRLQYVDEKGLPGGIYFLNLVCNGEKISQKILKK